MKQQDPGAAQDKFSPDNLLPLLQTISALVEKRCHRFLSREYGLTMPQYMLLLAATYGDSTTLGGLADQLNCSRGNLTGVADRLERDGWLVRERSTEDRRVVNIRLTDKGAQVWEIRSALAREMADLARVWTSEEREMLYLCLEKLYRDLKQERPAQEEASSQSEAS